MFLSSLLITKHAQAAEDSVHQVQAAYLFKFAQFATWPDKAFSDASSPLTIGVLGAHPFGRSLDSAVKYQTAHGRRMVVKYSRRAEDLKDSHIVYISSSEAERVEAVIATYQGLSILTVSDIPKFCKHGGIITFVVEDGSVRLHSNAGAARRAGILISSKLLKITKSSGD